MLAAASLVFFAFIGFDVVATAAEETKNPKRDLPRGIFGSLAIVTVLYVLVTIVLTAMVPYDQLGPAAAGRHPRRRLRHPGHARSPPSGSTGRPT